MMEEEVSRSEVLRTGARAALYVGTWLYHSVFSFLLLTQHACCSC